VISAELSLPRVAEDLSVRDKQGIDPPNRLKRATFDPSHGETLGVVFGLAFHHARKPMVNSDSLRASTTVLQTLKVKWDFNTYFRLPFQPKQHWPLRQETKVESTVALGRV
jgi:hypothetical protein